LSLITLPPVGGESIHLCGSICFPLKRSASYPLCEYYFSLSLVSRYEIAPTIELLFSSLILILFQLSPYLLSGLVFTFFMGLDQRLWLIFKFSCRNSISSHTEGLMLRRLWYDSARNKRCFEQRTDKLLINMPYIMSISAY
jgi:hypothetical protein